MMNKNQLRSVAILIVAALCCHFSLARLKEIRTEHKLNDEVVLRDAPPEIVFTTVALGSFRGLAANWLWIRNIQNQERMRYHESYQLARLITLLQPRYTSAVNYLAWNMAYNISVTVEDPAERWHWVKRGISLIRDEALRYNNNDPELYRELGWIFSHKIGQHLDNANRYYKIQWAIEMQKIYGDHPKWKEMHDLYMNPALLGAALKKQDLQGFEEFINRQNIDFRSLLKSQLSDSPLPAELAKHVNDQHIATIKNYAKASLNKSLEFKSLHMALSPIINLDSFIKSLGPEFNTYEKTFADFQRIGGLSQNFAQLIPIANSKEKVEVLRFIDLFMRRKWSEEVYQLDPETALQIEAELSPALDWRLPQAHSIYWAWKGKEAGQGDLVVQCERMIIHSLYSAFQSGRLLHFRNEEKMNIDWTQNPDLADTVRDINKGMIEKTGERGSSTFKTGYGNFLEEAILALYMSGDEAKAFEYLKEFQTHKNIKILPPLDSFVSDRFLEMYQSSDEDELLSAIHSMLQKAMLMVAYGEGYEDDSLKYYDLARTLYDSYVKRMVKFDKSRQLPPFQILVNSSQRAFAQTNPKQAKRFQELLKNNED
jgi:hypothetical protein